MGAVLKFLLYAVAFASAFLALGGFEAWRKTRRPALLVSSLTSVVCALLAMATGSWWPLLAGLALQFAIAAVFGRG